MPTTKKTLYSFRLVTVTSVQRVQRVQRVHHTMLEGIRLLRLLLICIPTWSQQYTWNIYCHYRSQRPSSNQRPHASCTSDIFQSKQKNQSLSRLIKNSHNKTIRESSKENIVMNVLGPQSPLKRKKKLPPECIIRSLSILPGMALQRRMPPMDILGSYQNPCMESASRETGQIRKSKWIQSENASHNPESSCAGWFCDLVLYFQWPCEKLTPVCIFCPVRRRKEIHRSSSDLVIPAWKGTTSGSQAGQITCGHTGSGLDLRTWHCPRGTDPRPWDY